MAKKTAALSALCMMTLLLLSSCVVAEKMTINDEYTKTTQVSGKNHIDLSVDDFFVDVLEDLSNWDDSGTNDAIIDVAVSDFQKNLERSKVTSSIKFTETGHNTYIGDFAFSDFNQLLSDLSNGNSDQSLLTMTEKDGHTRVEISINMDNYPQLTRIVPFLADPNFEVYGPLYNHDLTEEEYLEMVSFILGEQCPESIRNSSIRLQVVAPKAVLETNGKLRGKKNVEFTFPLIDFLLLHESIDFYLEY